MIQSGLQVIYTMDEVVFIQNLVYYVERAYRTPDFGLWQRGSKYNDGTPEIHARSLWKMNDTIVENFFTYSSTFVLFSSIGMAKAALEAINGCNLFGEKGSSVSVIYVDIDAHNRNRSIFETLLPRESSSKVLTFPHCLLSVLKSFCILERTRMRRSCQLYPGHVSQPMMMCCTTEQNLKLSVDSEATTGSSGFSEMATEQSWRIQIAVFITKAKLESVYISLK